MSELNESWDGITDAARAKLPEGDREARTQHMVSIIRQAWAGIPDKDPTKGVPAVTIGIKFPPNGVETVFLVMFIGPMRPGRIPPSIICLPEEERQIAKKYCLVREGA